MKKIFTTAVLAATLLLVGAGCSSADPVVTEAPFVPGQPVTDTVVATYNPGKGLDKKDITIKVGDSVEFRNSDLKARWPASAPHPQHTDYPEFDPKAAIQPGAVWRFTFTKAGDWKFHDHLTVSDANLRGVVHVK